MIAPLFSGVGVALVTIFDNKGAVDAKATARIAGQLVDLGVKSVLVAGTTGEAPSLTSDERAELVSAVRAALPREAVLIAGTGAPSARQAVPLTEEAVACGADAVLALSPPGCSDVRPYYDHVAKAAGGIPVLAYHFPAASAPGLPVSVLPELPVVGLKDSSGDPSRLYEELDVFDGWLYTGSANLVLLAGALECTGAILAIANSHPELSLRAFEGDGEAQQRLAVATAEMAARRPQSLKEAVAARFGTSPAVRMG
jgi:4-hydroxy-tetrahydrodipicolinate synthase